MECFRLQTEIFLFIELQMLNRYRTNDWSYSIGQWHNFSLLRFKVASHLFPRIHRFSNSQKILISFISIRILCHEAHHFYTSSIFFLLFLWDVEHCLCAYIKKKNICDLTQMQIFTHWIAMEAHKKTHALKISKHQKSR